MEESREGASGRGPEAPAMGVQERRGLIARHFAAAVAGAQVALSVSELVTAYPEWLDAVSRLAEGEGPISAEENQLLALVRDAAELAGNRALRAFSELQALELEVDLDALELGNFDPRPLSDVVFRWSEICRLVVMVAGRAQAKSAVLPGLEDVAGAQAQAAEILGEAEEAAREQAAALSEENPLRDIPLLHHSCAFCHSSRLMSEDPDIWAAFSHSWSEYSTAVSSQAPRDEQRTLLGTVLLVPNGAMPQISAWPRPLGLIAARCLMMHLIDRKEIPHAGDWVKIVDDLWGVLPEHLILASELERSRS